MCGIFGYNLTGSLVGGEFSNTLGHRGPDSFAEWSDESVYLSHSRLSIVALQNGAQPFVDTELVTMVNGEIFNFAELKSQLISRGAKFITNSDCEVIHHGYKYYGQHIFSKLEGIFAVAIWDRKEKSLTLARDPQGVKPIYYYQRGVDFAFTSEIKSFFLDVEGIIPKVNENALSEFLFYRYVRSSDTLFESIYKLCPGEIISYKNGEISKNLFSSDCDIRSPKSYIEAQHRLVEILSNSVQSQLMGDADIGIYLSGGIDSSTICALTTIYSTRSIRSYCVEFEEYPDHSEAVYAEQVANTFGTIHRNVNVSLRDVIENLFLMGWHYDEPMGDAAVAPTFLVSKVAASDGIKVILAGEGSDELFAGYSKYQILYNLAKSQTVYDQAELLNTWINCISVFDLNDLRALGVDRCQLDVLLSSVSADISKTKLTAENLVKSLLLTDQNSMLAENYLMKADKMTSAHGLEERVPFLDLPFVSFCRKLEVDQMVAINGGVYEEKKIIKNAFSNLLPLDIINRKKKGYGTPTSIWFKNELKILMSERIRKSTILKRFNQEYIIKLLDDHVNGRKNQNVKLWALLALDLWHYIYIENFAKIYNIDWDTYAPEFKEKVKFNI